jgi:hypothetical protein
MICIFMMLFEMISGPWDTPVNPEQLIVVGVMVGELVGSGVLDGVNVSVGLPGFVGIVFDGVLPEVGKWVDVGIKTKVGVLVVIEVGCLDGVGDSAANPVGKADPRIGMDIRNVRALADTIVNGSSGTTEMIG